MEQRGEVQNQHTQDSLTGYSGQGGGSNRFTVGRGISVVGRCGLVRGV